MLTKKPKYSYEMHTAFHAGCIKQFAGLNTQQISQDIFAKKTGIAPIQSDGGDTVAPNTVLPQPKRNIAASERTQ